MEATPLLLFVRLMAISCLILIVAGVSLLRERPEGFAVALWTASRPHLSLLRTIAIFLVGVPFVPYAALSTNKHETPKVAAPKVSKGRSQTSSVLTALWSPPQRRFPLQQAKSSNKRKRMPLIHKLSSTQGCLYLPHRMPNHSLPLLRRCFPRVGKVNLVMQPLRCEVIFIPVLAQKRIHLRH